MTSDEQTTTDGERTGGEAPSARTRVRRHPERGHYDAATIEPILDEGLVCHVGFNAAEGPVVLPTAYARVGDALYLHGAAGNSAMRTLATGSPVCVTVTLVDGLVLARAAFHHSINYRSVVIFGAASEVLDLEEKRAAMRALVEHLVPGRSADARPATDEELRATKVIRMSIDEASAKVRSGGPIDDERDLELPIWAGQVPLRLRAEEPIVDVTGIIASETPRYAARYADRWAREMPESTNPSASSNGATDLTTDAQ